jgi:hypothetical protein
MLNLMDAEILFTNPADVKEAIAELLKRDFSVKIRKDMIDKARPTVFILATGFSEHSLGTFFDWVQTIVAPLGGDVWDAGHARADIAGADHVEIDQMTANDNQRLRAI